MYHALVRRTLRRVFASLSHGDYAPRLVGLAPQFDHVFAGTHAVRLRWGKLVSLHA